MAPPVPPFAPVATRSSELDPAKTIKVYQAWLIALASFLGLVLLASAFLIILLFRRWCQVCDLYDDIKERNDRLRSSNDFLTRRVDKLQPQLDRLRCGRRGPGPGPGHDTAGGPSSHAARLDIPSSPSSSPSSFAPCDLTNLPMAPFVVADSDDSDDSDAPSYPDVAVLHMAKAQPVIRARKASVFTTGSSPRPLIMTLGSSGATTQSSPSPLRESFTNVSETVPVDDAKPEKGRSAAVDKEEQEEEDGTFSTFSGVHAHSLSSTE